MTILFDELQLGPHIKAHSVQRDDHHHLFLIDHRILTCTPVEYRLLLLLLSQTSRCVSYAQLQWPETDKKARVQRTISNLRAKLWPFGLDVSCLNGMGYVLLNAPEKDELDV